MLRFGGSISHVYAGPKPVVVEAPKAAAPVPVPVHVEPVVEKAPEGKK